MQSMSINEKVQKIKDNDNEINIFVDEYKPFVASCVQRVVGRYVKYGVDDELSIGLIGFVEAIKSFDNSKGSFLTFSQNVIKRRLIDYYRKEKKHAGVISLNEYNNCEDEEEERDLSEDAAIENYNNDEISEYRRLEIEELKKELQEWDISFLELTEVSPKYDKTRRLYKEIINYLLSQDDLVSLIKTKKYLPIAEIERGLKIPRKKIERARKYILSVIIIITGDYQYVKGYIDLG